jgi:hypothetical protein
MLAGTEVAHALAYWIVYPQAEVRLRVLAATGHGYLGWAPLLLGVGAALSLAGLVSSVVDAARHRTPRPVPAWAFGLLPLAAFTLQEFLERWLALGSVPWWMFEQETFRVGLVLQLPFAVLGYLLARILLRVAEHVAFLLRAERPCLTALPRLVPRFEAVSPVRIAALAGGHAERGPPPRARVALSLSS